MWKAANTTVGTPIITARLTRGPTGANADLTGVTATTTVVISTRMSLIMVVIIIVCMDITIFDTGITAIDITDATGAESSSASASHFSPCLFTTHNLPSMMAEARAASARFRPSPSHFPSKSR